MNAGLLVDSVWTPILAFTGTLVGCLLGIHSLARAVRSAAWSKRAGWLLLGSWAFVATSVWDTFFIAAVELQAEGVQVRYYLAPIIFTIIVIVTVSTAIFLYSLSTPHLAGIIGTGACLGIVMALGSFQALRALRANATVDFNIGILITATVVAMILTPLALAIALRWRRPGAKTGAAVLLAVVATVTQYLSLSAVDIGRPLGAATTQVGLIPVAVIIPVALAFVVRALLLLVLLLADPQSAARASSAVPSRRVL